MQLNSHPLLEIYVTAGLFINNGPSPCDMGQYFEASIPLTCRMLVKESRLQVVLVNYNLVAQLLMRLAALGSLT